MITQTRIFDADGKALVRLRIICPETGIFKSVCDKYAEYIVSSVFPSIKRDFENSDMERKYLRYPCESIVLFVRKNDDKKHTSASLHIKRERSGSVNENVPLTVLFK